MGMGEGEGEDRAMKAAKSAITSPLMTFPVTGAKGILLNVTTGAEILLTEMSDAAKIIEETADPDAQVIWGHVIDESLGEKVHVTLIATFPEDATHVIRREEPVIIDRTPKVAQNKRIPVQTQINIPQEPQPQIQQTPTPPRRTLYDYYKTKQSLQQQASLEEARLTQADEGQQNQFAGPRSNIYDQPSYTRRNARG